MSAREPDGSSTLSASWRTLIDRSSTSTYDRFGPVPIGVETIRMNRLNEIECGVVIQENSHRLDIEPHETRVDDAGPM